MAVTVSFFNNFIEDVGRNRINIATDTFKVALVNGYSFDATDADYASVSNTLITENGYTAPGQNLINITWAFGSGVTKFDADNISWVADGGSITATGAIIYSDTSSSPTADRLVCYIDFGETVEAEDDVSFKIIFNNSGILTIG